MIIYKDILNKLSAAGYTTTRLRKEKILGESILQRLRHDKPISLDTLDKICNLTGLTPSDLIEYKKDGEN